MTGWAIVDVVIGLTVVFFLLSITCSAIMELVAALLRWRAKNLSSAISSLLQDDGAFLTTFYDNPRIWTLSPDLAWWERLLPWLWAGISKLLPCIRNGTKMAPATTGSEQTHPATENTDVLEGQPNRDAPGELARQPVNKEEPHITGVGRPSYLDVGTFSDVLIELIAEDGNVPTALRGTFAAIRSALEGAGGHGDTRPPAMLRKVLRGFALSAVQAAPDNAPGVDALRLAAFRNYLGQWYRETMQRAGGWYKRKAQACLLVLGLLIAASVNIDAISIAQGLYSNPKLREHTDAVAQRLVQQQSSTGAADAPQRFEQARKELQEAADAGMPLGWSGVRVEGRCGWLAKIAGLLMTGACVSLGAPFWFDLLNKLVNLRSSGAPPKPATDDSKERDDTGATVAAPSAAVVAPAAAPMPTRAPGLPDGYWKQEARAQDFQGFTVDKADYEPKKACAMARASLLAYGNEGMVKTVAGIWGFAKNVQFIDCDDTQAFVAWKEDLILVAFRGTETTHLLDLLSDAECSLVDAMVEMLDANGKTKTSVVLRLGKAHYGFLKALGCAMDQIDQAVIEAVRDDKPRKLWITGHSLGAALATLYATRIQYTTNGKPEFKGLQVSGLYTFGSPRVGDRTFVGNLDEPLAGATCRFINHEDLVTRVAPRAMGYDHVGKMMYLKEDGTLEQGESAGWVRFLNTFVDALNDFKATAKMSVKDHSMELYVRKLENLAST